MAAPIASIAPIVLPSVSAPAQLEGAGGGGFQTILQSAIQQVEGSSAAANTAVKNYLSGGAQELHSAILATQNADLDMEMFLQVRNKVVSAYEEIMRMQV
jgi:flagellar hook-basal body complex protein FliE